jgi:3-oxoadipate enol-lactonase
MTPRDGFASTRHGRIHYVEAGTGSPLLLLHSNGCSAHEYLDAMRTLAVHHRCIAWDMPGHGDSDRPSHHLRVIDYADAVLALMDALGIARAHVCGASIGGMVCIALGARAAERLMSTIIVEAPLRSADDWAAQWARIEAQFAIPSQSPDALKGRFRTVSPELLARWNIDREKAGSWRMVDVMWAIRDYDAIADLKRITAPAAVIVGNTGPVFGHRQRYAEYLPDAPLTVMQDAGHFPMLDDPGVFADAVVAAIRSVGAQD